MITYLLRYTVVMRVGVSFLRWMPLRRARGEIYVL